MSDYERGKFYNKKKYSRAESSSYGSRFYNSSGKTSYSRGESELYKDKEEPKDGKATPVKQPTILLKARDRDDRSLSPKRQPKEPEQQTTHVVIATPAATESATPACVKQMNKSVKFVEDGIIFTEHLQDYLEENNDFVVVGIVGGHGVGKSSIMNLLAHSSVTDQLKKKLFANTTEEPEDFGSFENIKILTDNVSSLKLNEEVADNSHLIFEVQNSYTAQNHLNATTGIDLFISQNRVIFLDCQPFLSASVLDDLMRMDENNKRTSVVSDCLPAENNGEIQSLQLAAFLMSVCHVLILVQDWFVDSNVVRFIQTAEMLKPTISSPEDECLDYFPHLILLHNKAQMEDYSPERFKMMQKFYKAVFNKTKVHLESGMGLGTGRVIPYLDPKNCGDPINLFLLPDNDNCVENMFKGHPPLEELIKKLKSNILGCTKYPLTHYTLSEKNWLLYSAKVWEQVKKSSFFVEYSKLMP